MSSGYYVADSVLEYAAKIDGAKSPVTFPLSTMLGSARLFALDSAIAVRLKPWAIFRYLLIQLNEAPSYCPPLSRSTPKMHVKKADPGLMDRLYPSLDGEVWAKKLLRN